MKKKLLIIGIILSSFFLAKPVYAAKGDFIYDIESFSVTSDKKIVFEGWAYLDGYHNTGGSDTKISIIAGDKVEKEAVYNSSKDYALYYANCYKVGKTCTDTYETAQCGGSTRSNCRFDNVSFKIEFDIEELVKEIGKDKTIDFRIKISHSKGGTASSDIAVSSHTAGTFAPNLTLNDGTEVTVEVSDISDTVRIRKDYGRVATNTAGDLLVPTQFYWKIYNVFYINDIKSSTNSQYGGMKMYQLNFNCNSVGCVSGGHAIPGSDRLGWAYASWVQINGSVKIKFSTEETSVEIKECASDYENIPGKLECSTSLYEEIMNVDDLEVERTITEDDDDYNERRNVVDGEYLEKENGDFKCNSNLTQVINTGVTITQTGSPVFDITPSSIYSGGGFLFDASYSGKASYVFCKDITYTVEEKYIAYSCPSSSAAEDDVDDYYDFEEGEFEGDYEETFDVWWESYSDFDSGELTSDNANCVYEGVIKTKFHFSEDDYEYSEVEFDSDESMEFYDDLCDDRKITCRRGNCYCTIEGYVPYISRNDSINFDYYGDQEWVLESNKKCKTYKDGETFTCDMNNLEKDCPNEVEAIAEEMSDSYLKSTSSFKNSVGAVTKSKASNKVSKSNNANEIIGSWDNDYKKEAKWYSGVENEVGYELEFVLGTACINRFTATVSYKSKCDYETEIDGGNLYYVPLKEPDGSYFPVKVTINQLSFVKGMSWDLDYECGVNCQQKLYENPPDDMSYKFIYRPISLSNPFPGREPGSNWTMFMEDSKAVNSKMNRKTLEYSATLNSSMIQSIKNYNNGKLHTDMTTIDYTGTSSFIDSVLGSSIREKKSYNKLGECTKDCWVESLFFEDGGY